MFLSKEQTAFSHYLFHNDPTCRGEQHRLFFASEKAKEHGFPSSN
jgi:hypothetical protein